MQDRPTILVLGFKTTYEKNQQTGKVDRAVDWVHFAPVHSATYTQITERVDFLRPDPAKIKNDDQGLKIDMMRDRWAQIEPAYKAWKEGHDIPEHGTALGSWPGINEAQAQAFRGAGIKTVEQVSTMPESVIARVPLPGVRDLKAQAAAFLENSDRAAAAAKVTEQDAKIAALEEQLAAAMELLSEKAEAEKPRRGRPRKEDAGADDAEAA